eukprot:CAMPEP_0197845098 /NCGR_PEP_ID=MMETSP1438-20131217/2042_1 /TAXON_ID=1461541 /ORGANISM="Pterosperma sp., Strain CCMP1384" /LENGTH=624 /DNA_ID=CAMNT_0043456215 /DNA_START=463 /DNA_END=2337 /DNA_ORIENTATION=-
MSHVSPQPLVTHSGLPRTSGIRTRRGRAHTSSESLRPLRRPCFCGLRESSQKTSPKDAVSLTNTNTEEARLRDGPKDARSKTFPQTQDSTEDDRLVKDFIKCFATASIFMLPLQSVHAEDLPAEYVVSGLSPSRPSSSINFPLRISRAASVTARVSSIPPSPPVTSRALEVNSEVPECKPQSKLEKLKSKKAATDTCDDSVSQPKEGAEKKAGSQGGVEDIQAAIATASSEWGAGKTAAAVAVGGAALLGIGAVLGVDVAVALLALPGLVASEVAEVTVPAGVASLTSGAAQVAQVAETGEAVTSAAALGVSVTTNAPAVGEAVSAASAVADVATAADVASGVAAAADTASTAAAVTAGTASTATTATAVVGAAGVAEVASNVAAGGEVAANVAAVGSGTTTTATAVGAVSSAAGLAEVAGNAAGGGAVSATASGASAGATAVGGSRIAPTAGRVAKGAGSLASKGAKRIGSGGAAGLAAGGAEVAGLAAGGAEVATQIGAVELGAAEVGAVGAADIGAVGAADVATTAAVEAGAGGAASEVAAVVASSAGTVATVAAVGVAGSSFMALLKGGVLTKIATSFITTRAGIWGVRQLWDRRPGGALDVQKRGGREAELESNPNEKE